MSRPIRPAWLNRVPLDDQAAALADYEERAAVMEYLGEMSREDAEEAAARLVAARWTAVAP